MFPTGGSPTDLTAPGPQAAYISPGGTFVPQPIGQKTGKIGPDPTQEQINQEIAESQQGKPVAINLAWLLSQPESESKNGLIAIVASLNKLLGA